MTKVIFIKENAIGEVGKEIEIDSSWVKALVNHGIVKVIDSDNNSETPIKKYSSDKLMTK